MTPRSEMLQRCFDYYISHLRRKQSESKEKSYPKFVEEDIKIKIEELGKMGKIVEEFTKDVELQVAHYGLLSDSLTNYRQALLKSIALVKGEIQTLRHPFTNTKAELKLVEEARRDFGLI